jgi:hypothetical protein
MTDPFIELKRRDDGFAGLMNKYRGYRAIVIGKGPSYDDWTGPEQDDITIGLKDVGLWTPVMYSITTDGYQTPASGKLGHLVGLPASPVAKREDPMELHAGDMWFHLRQDCKRKYPALQLTRERVRDSRFLAAASSTAQPAVHLAWYMGCTSLLLVGIDGGGGHAKRIRSMTAPVDDSKYRMMRKDTDHIVETLFHTYTYLGG